MQIFTFNADSGVSLARLSTFYFFEQMHNVDPFYVVSMDIHAISRQACLHTFLNVYTYK